MLAGVGDFDGNHHSGHSLAKNDFRATVSAIWDNGGDSGHIVSRTGGSGPLDWHIIV